MCAEPLFVYFYIQICIRCETITLINASIILKKEEYEYSTFPNKGITKYSIVTNSNDSVTLRLATEHDLAMLYEWLNRSHIVEWWAEKHARHDVQEQYLPTF